MHYTAVADLGTLSVSGGTKAPQKGAPQARECLAVGFTGVDNYTRMRCVVWVF